jgi:hypothetical protein
MRFEGTLASGMQLQFLTEVPRRNGCATYNRHRSIAKEGDMANGPAGVDDSFDPTYSPSGSEVTARSRNGSRAVTWNPQEGTVKISARDETEWDRGVGGTRMQYTQLREGSVALGRNYEERRGTTQFSVEAQFVAGAQGGISGLGRHANTGAESEVLAGARSRYRVSLPGEASNEQALGVNPFDPTTLPPGGRIMLDSQAFTQRGLELSFRHIATVNNVTEAQGTGISITRLDEQRVRVVTGPNSAVEALQGIGVDTGVARVIAGRQDLLGSSSLQTADFDLRQPDAQAAYARFLATGRIASETPGVDNVARVDRLDFSSQQRLQLGLFDDRVGADLAGRRNTGVQLRTTQPNDDYTLTQQFRYDQNVPLTITRQYDHDGNERVGERSYQFRVDTDVESPGWLERNIGGRNEATEERNLATNMNAALAGTPGVDGPVRPGQAVTVTFTEAQMQALMARSNAVLDRNPMGGDPMASIARDGHGQPRRDGYEFALAMARNSGGDANGFSARMLHVANDGNPGGPIRPIDAQVEGDEPARAQVAAMQAPAAQPADASTARVDDPREPGHQDHALYGQCLAAMHRVDADLGRQPDESTRRMAMAAMVTARQCNMDRVDHVVLGDHGRAFVVQGPLASPAHLRAGFDSNAAICTPTEESLRQLQAVNADQQRQQDANQQQEALRPGMVR